MKVYSVEGSYEEEWPVNWEHLGTIVIIKDKLPEFIRIDCGEGASSLVVYEKKGG